MPGAHGLDDHARGSAQRRHGRRQSRRAIAEIRSQSYQSARHGRLTGGGRKNLSTNQPFENLGGDIQFATKAADDRSLRSRPPSKLYWLRDD